LLDATSLVALLGELSGADEVLSCAHADGRLQADLAEAVGAYGQIIPIRTRFEDGTSLAEIVDQVRRARTDGTRWQDYASAEDLSELGRAAGIGFAYFPPAGLAPLGTAAVELRALSAPLGRGMWLQCNVKARGDGIDAWLEYDPRAICSDDAQALAARFATLLQSAAADAHTAVDRLAITEGAERAELLAAAAGPAAVVPAIAIHERFEDQARRFPNRVAVRSANGRLTFAELDAAANRLAGHLRASGVSRDVAVGLCMERVPEMVIAVLAILKAGGAYVPLNSEHPAERLAHQLLECKAPVLLTQKHLLDALPAFDGHTLCVDRDAELIAQSPAGPVKSVTEPHDLAYVIYTSGSTGLPKGVAVTHANLANYTAHMLAQLGLDGEHYVDGPQAAVLSSISTDLGNTTIFPTLAAGGCLHLISPEASMDPDAFAAQTRAHPLDILKITPSHLRALLSGNGDGVLPRRWLILGGEALPWELVQLIASLKPSCGIINHYGPTETTIGCCTFELDPPTPREDAATVPIGRPVANTRAYVVDRAGEPVPAGVGGELWIGGAGVTRGYLSRSEETADRFPSDPFLADPSERVYRTGDRVRRLRDGTIEFLGRVDQQVKIRGYRVEPSEVEAVLARHPAVKQAAVVPREDARGIRLIAYVVAPAKPTVAELTEFLSRSLPEFMLPSACVTIDALPLSPSGKVDRMALVAISDAEGQREDEFVAPRDQLEQEIAEIWRELLGVERVGVHDDFFALGGHSLLATQAIMRIRRAHGDIPLHALLGAPTVGALADVVRASASENADVWQNVEGRGSSVSLVARDRRGA
jgi:amino acid adenylation domain-containing protein